MIKGTPTQRRRYSPAIARRCSVSGPCTSARGDLRLGRPSTERRAILGQHAHPASRFAGVAHPAAVKDHPVTEQRPLLAFDEFADGVLDLDRVLLGRPAPTPDQAPEMGVDGDSRDVERVAQDDVRGLAPHTGQRHQFVHGVGQFAVESLNQRLTEANQRRRFIAIKTGWPNEGFEFFAIGLRVIQCGAITEEQRRGGEIYPLVRALRRQDRRHRELQRRGEVQLAMRIRKRLCEFAIHPARPAHQAGSGLRGPTAGDSGAGPGSGFAGGTRRFGRCHLDRVLIRDPAETLAVFTSCLCPGCWLPSPPALLMLATFGLQRLESGLENDTLTASDVAEFLEQAEPVDVRTLAREGMPEALDSLHRRINYQTAPLPSSAEPDTDQWSAATLIAAPNQPTSPRHQHQHSRANRQFAPREHANRV